MERENSPRPWVALGRLCRIRRLGALAMALATGASYHGSYVRRFGAHRGGEGRTPKKPRTSNLWHGCSYPVEMGHGNEPRGDSATEERQHVGWAEKRSPTIFRRLSLGFTKTVQPNLRATLHPIDTTYAHAYASWVGGDP